MCKSKKRQQKLVRGTQVFVEDRTSPNIIYLDIGELQYPMVSKQNNRYIDGWQVYLYHNQSVCFLTKDQFSLERYD